MAIGIPTQRANVANDGASATTASFTPTANSRLFACAFGSVLNGSAPTIPTVSDSLGGTWNLIADDTFDFTATRDSAIALYYQDIGGSPAAMTVTAASTSALETGVQCQDITGITSSDFSNVNFNGSNTGDPAFTLSALQDANSAVAVWIFAVQGNNSFSQAALTEIQDTTVSTPGGDDYRFYMSYDLTSPSTSFTVTSNNARAFGYALELKEDAGGDKNITGALFTDPDTFHAGTITKTYEILGSLFTDADTIYSGQVDLVILGGLFSDADNFPTGVVTTDYTITGSLFSDPDTFYNGVVERESDEEIDGSLFVDPDTFHSGTVTTDYAITGSLFVDPDTFHAGSISATYNINGNLYIDPDIFYSGAIEGGADVGTSTSVTSYMLLRRRRKAGE